MVINIDNLPNFTSIFEEIEKRSRENRVGAFTTVEANTAKIRKPLKKTKPLAVTQRESTKLSTFGRNAIDSASRSSCRVIERRVCNRSVPCLLIDPAKLQGEPRLTEAANKLSNEELASLYEDILKPVLWIFIQFFMSEAEKTRTCAMELYEVRQIYFELNN